MRFSAVAPRCLNRRNRSMRLLTACVYSTQSLRPQRRGDKQSRDDHSHNLAKQDRRQKNTRTDETRARGGPAHTHTHTPEPDAYTGTRRRVYVHARASHTAARRYWPHKTTLPPRPSACTTALLFREAITRSIASCHLNEAVATSPVALPRVRLISISPVRLPRDRLI